MSAASLRAVGGLQTPSPPLRAESVGGGPLTRVGKESGKEKTLLGWMGENGRRIEDREVASEEGEEGV